MSPAAAAQISASAVPPSTGELTPADSGSGRPGGRVRGPGSGDASRLCELRCADPCGRNVLPMVWGES